MFIQQNLVGLVTTLRGTISFNWCWPLVFTGAEKTELDIAQKQKEHDVEIAKDAQREALLQAHLDRMTELLLRESLRTAQPDSEVCNVARVRTLTILGQLDTSRINHVLSFLREAKLVTSQPKSYSAVSGMSHHTLEMEPMTTCVDGSNILLPSLLGIRNYQNLVFYYL
ncbi:hypothetical protein KSB_90030 [Ktedonobacter robiniae]|uniref:Uncharacterized protein n=1 Tax=Ktedonobacter robiniae TaxID=2778365 RepID=A0ABQ3V6I1_9CHLR|nr:hypothetical protein KSB_90030 [Ktedonobacter robiniae]